VFTRRHNKPVAGALRRAVGDASIRDGTAGDRAARITEYPSG